MGASPSTLRELIVAGNLQALKNAVQEHDEQTINYALDASDTTPLLLASRQFRPKIVAWLCENGADLTRQDDRGWTPLHWASSAGDVGAAAVLLDRGADSSRRDIVGRLPRHLLELAVCDASTDEIHERLVESELQTIGDATHSLAVPATVYAGRPGARIVVEVRAPEYHDESDYVQLYVERLVQGQLNLEPPTPAQAMSAMANNLMPRYGSYRYVAKGRRSVVIFDSAPMEVGLRLRAVYVRADGVVVLASEAFSTTLLPASQARGAGSAEPEWQLFVSKTSGARYYVNTTTGESVDELPEGTAFGTDNVEGYADGEERAAGGGGDEGQDHAAKEAAAALRVELGALKASELKKRARAVGVGQDSLDAADDQEDPKAEVIELLLLAAVGSPGGGDGEGGGEGGVPHALSTPVNAGPPEPEPEQNGVAMTPEQMEFRSHLNEFRNIAADLGHAVLTDGQEAWDQEEEAGLCWSHATLELSEQEARGEAPTGSMDWLLTGWTEESAALGTAVQAPFDRWCPTTTPGAPTPSPAPPVSTAAAAAEAKMRAEILLLSSPKHDPLLKVSRPRRRLLRLLRLLPSSRVARSRLSRACLGK